ncbi:hypothetical protein [Streptomyces sp. XD-27]|uniref:hypothetical protein n=1 Tax=Streptomyces sp. XD-27 TaxID=3062779 RepID=UPI0026F416E9|nr:hypothetical protein [Streptomyces sp. XD-27]WKX74062.1 hypothetical protein Q3Y56_33120 [Streptomyces sp. XD-27]
MSSLPRCTRTGKRSKISSTVTSVVPRASRSVMALRALYEASQPYTMPAPRLIMNWSPKILNGLVCVLLLTINPASQ